MSDVSWVCLMLFVFPAFAVSHVGEPCFAQNVEGGDMSRVSNDNGINEGSVPGDVGRVLSNPFAVMSGERELFRVKHNLEVLVNFNTLLPKDKDRFLNNDTHSVYYGLARPLMREIYLEGEHALPVLSEFFESKVHLYYYRGVRSMALGEIADASLGIVAGRLFEDIVCPVHAIRYKTRKGTDGQEHVYPNFYQFLGEQSVGEWWETNKEKSLLEIQRTVVDFYIAREKEIGFPDKSTEQEYLVPLYELRNRVPYLDPEYLR